MQILDIKLTWFSVVKDSSKKDIIKNVEFFE